MRPYMLSIVNEVPEEVIKSRVEYEISQEKFRKPFGFCSTYEKEIVNKMIEIRNKAAQRNFKHDYYYCSEREKKFIRSCYQ